MASGSKTSSIFTGNDTGKGKSSMIKTSAMPGGTINCAYPQDNVHGYSVENSMGGSMGGSDTNLSHSLSGASAVQRQKGKAENSGI